MKNKYQIFKFNYEKVFLICLKSLFILPDQSVAMSTEKNNRSPSHHIISFFCSNVVSDT